MNSRNISLNKFQVSITKKFTLLFSGLLLWSSLFAQSEVELNPDGIVFPRLDSLGVNSPINGTLIYDSATVQLIYYNGVRWMAVGGPFEKVGTLVRPRTGQDIDDFIFGRDALPENGENVLDTFFFFDRSKNAFRGGRVNSTDWSPDSIGANSFAYGESVKASGIGSLAMGSYASSLGNYGSMAFGHLSEATGDYGSIAMGLGCDASGITGSSAIGNGCSARGNFGNTAIGYFAYASGDTASNSIGFGTEATGDNGATAMGKNSLARGNVGATAIGYAAQALGDTGATAIGYLTAAVGKQGATALGSGSVSVGNVGCTSIGYNTTSAGDSGATAIGYLTQAYGLIGATALGDETIAAGNFGATALGSGSSATGDGGATAMGLATQAVGHAGATALGNSTTALGNIGATALGYGSSASGNLGATALGNLTTATGDNGATAIGLTSGADGDFGAIAIGESAASTGDHGAVALGYLTTTSGSSGAVSIGYLTTAAGDNGATAIGLGTTSNGNSCTVVGTYNDTIVPAKNSLTTISPVFIVGNGDAGSGNESNAFVVRKDGNVSIGNTNPLVRLQVGSNGDGTVARANAWNLFSDRRFKQDIIPINNALNLVNQLEGRSFEWKTNGKKDIGFIAQEVEKIVDYIVTTDSDGFKSLDYGKIVPLLVEAIKELTLEVESLKKQK